MEGKDIVEYIKINDSLKEVNFKSIDLKGKIPVFLICPLSFDNIPNLDIKKLASRQCTNGEIKLISKSPIRLDFTYDEVMSLKKNNKDFFFGNVSFLSKIGISPYILTSSNIYYFAQNSKKFIFFQNENKLLRIESANPFGIYSPNINNNININIDINNIRKNIIKCSVLLYANEKEMERLYSSNIPGKYDIKNYKLINKYWLDIFKENFYYKFKKLITAQSHLYQFDTYNDYLKNLDHFESLAEFQNLANLIYEVPMTLSQQIKITPGLKLDLKNPIIKWPINFELIHESLFNLLKQFVINDTDTKANKSQYRIILGMKTLYLQSINLPIFFFIYEYDKSKSYKIAAISKFENESFHGEYNNYLCNRTFLEYISIKNIDINEINQIQNILNTKNQRIGDLILFKHINPNYNTTNANQDNLNLISNWNQNNQRNDNTLFKNQNNLYNQNISVDNSKYEKAMNEIRELKKENNGLKNKNTILIEELNEEKKKVKKLNNKIKLLEDSLPKDINLEKIKELEEIIEKQNIELEQLRNKVNTDNNNYLKAVEENENENNNENENENNNENENENNNENDNNNNVNDNNIDNENDNNIDNENDNNNNIDNENDNNIDEEQNENAEEELINMNFISNDEKIHFTTKGKKTDLFVLLEEKFYNKYPEYKDSDLEFTVNGNKVNISKTLEENQIKNGDNIIFNNEIQE